MPFLKNPHLKDWVLGTVARWVVCGRECVSLASSKAVRSVGIQWKTRAGHSIESVLMTLSSMPHAFTEYSQQYREQPLVFRPLYEETSWTFSFILACPTSE